MWTSAIVAYLHYLSFGLILASLAVENRFFKKDLSVREAWTVLIADGVYGTAGTLVLITGLLRVFYFAKDPSFYSHNPVFWVKISIFFIVGLLSLYPTISYVLWIGGLQQNTPPEISEFRANAIANLIKVEIVGFAAIPLFASLMARGIGLE